MFPEPSPESRISVSAVRCGGNVALTVAAGGSVRLEGEPGQGLTVVLTFQPA
jgi:hypothetical protein